MLGEERPHIEVEVIRANEVTTASVIVDETRSQKIRRIKALLASGEYRVSNVAIAKALIRTLHL